MAAALWAAASAPWAHSEPLPLLKLQAHQLLLQRLLLELHVCRPEVAWADHSCCSCSTVALE